MIIVHTVSDVRFLPIPNTVEICLSDELVPAELSMTSFVLPIFEDGSFLFAVNQARGVEIPGGHVEDGETLEDAAIREAFEETGALVTDLKPIGYLRMTSSGTIPDDWRYPHPLSYQQFFMGRISEIVPYTANDECAEPVTIHDLTDARLVRASIQVFCQHAREMLFCAKNASVAQLDRA